MTELRGRAIDAFLDLVAQRGYAAVALRDVGEAAGLGLAAIHRLFADKPALIAGFMARTDDAVMAATPAQRDPDETARDRLFDVLMRRFDALKPHRPALRSLSAAVERDPLLALTLVPPMRRSMAAMLEAAGLASDGLPGALRQNGLTAIYFTVSRTFYRDESVDLSKTMAALDSRLKTAERWSELIEKYTVIPSRKARVRGSQSPAG